MAKIHSIVSGQVPEFVQANYPAFLEFVKAYYKWLDEQQEFYGDIIDVDNTPTQFVEFFKKQLDVYQYLSSSPYFDIKYLKNIKEIYSSKGSENLLVRVLELAYNSKATVDYPGKYILKASDGKWVREASITLTHQYGTIPNYFDYFYIKNANKERVRVLKYEILNTGNLRITFNSSDRVTINDADYVEIKSGNDVVYVGQVVKTAAKLKILDGGLNWQLGQIFKIPGTVKNTYGKISKVDFNGTVINAVIYEYGYNHTEGQIITSYPTPVHVAGEDATFEVQYDVISNLEGHWKDDSGKLSNDTIRLHDNFYYQIYSYIINSDLPTADYIDFANKINPAGNKLFTSYNLNHGITLAITGETRTPYKYLYFGPEIISIVDAVTLRTVKVVSDTITTSEILTKIFGSALTDMIVAVDTKTLSVNKVLTETLTLSENWVNILVKTLTETLTLSETYTNILVKALTETINITETLSLISIKSISETMTLSHGAPVISLGETYTSEVYFLETYVSADYNITI